MFIINNGGGNGDVVKFYFVVVLQKVDLQAAAKLAPNDKSKCDCLVINRFKVHKSYFKFKIIVGLVNECNNKGHPTTIALTTIFVLKINSMLTNDISKTSKHLLSCILSKIYVVWTKGEVKID